MEESESLDIFLQPSRRLLFFSALFVVTCILLLLTIPLSFQYKILMFLVMAIGISVELRRTVFLMSSRSIIRIGYDGGVADKHGHVSDVCWWYQCRAGEKVYAPLGSGSRVWAQWVALDFSRWPWQWGLSVVVARDSVEQPDDFQRLKRVLRS